MSYRDYGYDRFFRRTLRSDSRVYSASEYDSYFEDESVISEKIFDGAIKTEKLGDSAVTTVKIENLAVTDAKIASITADKILAGTIGVGLNVGGPSVRILGDDPNGGTILFFNNGIPSIVIGNPNVTL